MNEYSLERIDRLLVLFTCLGIRSSCDGSDGRITCQILQTFRKLNISQYEISVVNY